MDIGDYKNYLGISIYYSLSSALPLGCNTLGNQWLSLPFVPLVFLFWVVPSLPHRIVATHSAIITITWGWRTRTRLTYHSLTWHAFLWPCCTQQERRAATADHRRSVYSFGIFFGTHFHNLCQRSNPQHRFKVSSLLAFVLAFPLPDLPTRVFFPLLYFRNLRLSFPLNMVCV